MQLLLHSKYSLKWWNNLISSDIMYIHEIEKKLTEVSSLICTFCLWINDQQQKIKSISYKIASWYMSPWKNCSIRQTVVTRLCIDWIKRWIWTCGILFFVVLFQKRFRGWLTHAHTVIEWLKGCLMGFKSGDLDGQGNTVTEIYRNMFKNHILKNYKHFSYKLWDF